MISAANSLELVSNCIETKQVPLTLLYRTTLQAAALEHTDSSCE